MTTSDVLADRLARMIGDLDGYIERRAREIADPLIAEAEARAHAAIAENDADSAARARRDSDLIAEMRRQITTLDRSCQRAWAQLRESGARIYGRVAEVPGEVRADNPAGQILHWVGQIMPEWPDDQELHSSITSYRGPFGVNRTAVDFECHPSPSSRGFPVGAFIRAVQAVATHDRDATATDVIVTVRNVLAGNNVAQVADSIADNDRRMADL